LKKMLLLAGEGKIPLLVYERARKEREVLVLSCAPLRVERDLPLCEYLPSFSLGHLVRFLTTHRIEEICLAGKVPKATLFEHHIFEQVIREWSSPSFEDRVLGEIVLQRLEERGIRCLSPLLFLRDHLMPADFFFGSPLDASDWSDIRLGAKIARFLADAEVGQTVVVKRGTVLAAEGAEGTDETIRRGLTLACGGGAVVKMARTQQSFLVDIPAIGLQTVELIGQHKGRVLAVESGKTLFLEREEALRKAKEYSINIAAITG